MASPRHLGKAPIREALIDLRVDLGANRELGRISSVRDAIQSDYGDVHERVPVSMQLQLSGNGVQQTLSQGTPDGFACRNADGRRIVQVSLDGFTFSQLRPYTSWGDVSGEARRAWDIYSERATPATIKRAAVRFINEIDLTPGGSLADAITRPHSVPGLEPGQATATFLTRALVTSGPDRPRAWVTQAYDGTTLILDIDVFREYPDGATSESAWRDIEAMRTVKNRLFFEAITEATAGRYA